MAIFYIVDNGLSSRVWVFGFILWLFFPDFGDAAQKKN